MLTSPDTLEWIGLVVSVVIPILVDLVTKRFSDPKVKAITLAVLASANGFLVEFLQNTDDFDLNRAILNAVTSFLIATAAFFGFWRPTGVSGDDGAVQRAVPAGVGSAQA